MTGPWRPGREGDHDDEPDRGGDPVCWLNRVCPECGMFAEHEPPTACSRCGADLPVD